MSHASRDHSVGTAPAWMAHDQAFQPGLAGLEEARAFSFDSSPQVYWHFSPDVYAFEQLSMSVSQHGLYEQQYQGVPGSHPITPAHPLAPIAMYAPADHEKREVQGTSTPRRTLTNDDRRRMCLYHMEHPRVKQADIGKLFGVERSTVSKVLQKKDYFLSLGEEAISPARRSGRKNPDVEKTLANYIRKKEHQKLSDEEILKTAISFCHSSHDAEIRSKMSDLKWVREFRQRVLQKTTGVASRTPPVESGPLPSPSTSGSGPGSRSSSKSGSTPDVPQNSRLDLELSPFTGSSGGSSCDDLYSMVSANGLAPLSRVKQETICPIDPVLFTFDKLHRDRTPSLTTLSTASSLFEQPTDDPMSCGFVAPQDLLQTRLRDIDWSHQTPLASEPAAKKLCSDMGYHHSASIPAELDVILFEHSAAHSAADELASLSDVSPLSNVQARALAGRGKRQRE